MADVELPDLDAIVAKWAPRICPGWTVKIVWSDDVECLAECDATIELSLLLIRVSTKTPDYYAEFSIPRDYEADVVHELWHAIWAYSRPKYGTMDYRIWEQNVEHCAKVCIALDRGN